MPQGSAPWIDLSGRVAVVTGAASGIGRASAMALAGAGAQVILLDLDEAGLAAAGAEIGAAASIRKLDVTSETEWADAAAWIERAWGCLDILVNSAGIVSADSAGAASLDGYHRICAVNVQGSLLGMATALRFMRASGAGAIINIASNASFRASSALASYGAGKAAIAHFTKSAAAKAVRPGHDIRINSVHPGLTDTPMAEAFYKIHGAIGGHDQIISRVTTGRAALPEEVADLVLFPSSERARFISGAAIPIDRAQSA